MKHNKCYKIYVVLILVFSIFTSVGSIYHSDFVYAATKTGTKIENKTSNKAAPSSKKTSKKKSSNGSGTSVKSIKVTFHNHMPNVKNSKYTFKLDWGFDLILPKKSKPAKYNKKLSIASITLAESAYSESRVKTMLEKYGFKKIKTFNYDKKSLTKPAIAMGYRKVSASGKTYNVIAMAIRGASNIADKYYKSMTTGSELIDLDEYNDSTINLKKKLKNFVTDVTGKSFNSSNNIFLITGHCIGGTYADFLADKMISDGINNVYCYSFAPLLIQHDDFGAGKHNVHNVLSAYDILSYGYADINGLATIGFPNAYILPLGDVNKIDDSSEGYVKMEENLAGFIKQITSITGEKKDKIIKIMNSMYDDNQDIDYDEDKDYSEEEALDLLGDVYKKKANDIKANHAPEMYLAFIKAVK